MIKYNKFIRKKLNESITNGNFLYKLAFDGPEFYKFEKNYKIINTTNKESDLIEDLFSNLFLPTIKKERRIIIKSNYDSITATKHEDDYWLIKIKINSKELCYICDGIDGVKELVKNIKEYALKNSNKND